LPDQYYDLTIGEITRHYKAYQTRESKEWEKVRFLAWFGSLPYMKKNSHIQPEDIMKLKTDPTEEEREIMRLEREREADEYIKKVFENYRSLGYQV
jgi:hypothetical protein